MKSQWQIKNKQLPKDFENEITDWDRDVYSRLTAVQLTREQEKLLKNPTRVFEREESVLAVHWHPETVPMKIIEDRINRMFPNRSMELIIPTQHNDILSYKGFSGVEVDCYSPEFNRKVQLLFHFENSRLKNAHVLKSMINHTFKYRQTQLFEFIDTVINPKLELRLQMASKSTGTEDELVDFVKTFTTKLKRMIDENYTTTPQFTIKNKLLMNYFSMLREYFDDHYVERAIVFLTEVKKIVKANFVLDYFYKTQEFIEEVRALGGGIVIPHPEQFWPVLLADYDVDGLEVWNPQSREFTEFLIQVTMKKNKTREYQERPLLVMLGDDCHMGEKLLPKDFQRPAKVAREIGLQPTWNDIAIRKSLILANLDKKNVIDEYKKRLQHP